MLVECRPVEFGGKLGSDAPLIIGGDRRQAQGSPKKPHSKTPDPFLAGYEPGVVVAEPDGFLGAGPDSHPALGEAIEGHPRAVIRHYDRPRRIIIDTALRRIGVI